MGTPRTRRDTVLTCYSGAGFNRELQAGRRHGIRLVGLDQLYPDQGGAVSQKALMRVPTVTCGKLRPRKLSRAVCE